MDKCEKSLFDALENIIWYDGHYEWLKELRDELAQHQQRFYPMPHTIEWHTDQHTIWMLLVGMYGSWGTSIRSGWIEEIDECIQFIDAVCKESWEAEEREKENA